ncbi:MAG: hypothetical protein HY852_15995 [Bradyrhizobium sp.]|uniref:hypothetical protein n=1 Tax=Bradyrhizobium sp. TaxID=376 RepID=UPI0025BE46B2|nr:hypothetical protein [Bradyrhizobium sp.]MBI5263311.1 hypothetical protein [Bradyrhizobium sp.]
MTRKTHHIEEVAAVMLRLKHLKIGEIIEWVCDHFPDMSGDDISSAFWLAVEQAEEANSVPRLH